MSSKVLNRFVLIIAMVVFSSSNSLGQEVNTNMRGAHEVEHREMLTKFLGVDPVIFPWCAAFVNATEKQEGRKGTGSLLARSFLKYGEEVTEPRLGDIVIFSRGLEPWMGHVGYFIARMGDWVLVFGGNQQDKVSYERYRAENVLGYRRP